MAAAPTRPASLRSTSRPSARGGGATSATPRFGVVAELLDRPLASWWLVLVSSALLVGLGALMVLSSSSVYSQFTNDGDPYYIAKRQLLFLVLGLPIAAWLSRQAESTLKLLGWVGFVGSLVLLLAVFVPGIGNDAGKGNLAWIRLGPVSMQPSEFAKLGLVLWTGALVSAKERLLDRPRELAPVGVGFLVVMVLILAQKDLGTAMVVAVIFLGMLWVIGIPLRMFGAICTAGLLTVALMVVTSPNRMRRIFGADDPNASQQPLAAVYAFATGGWWGVGLGESRQKWGNLNDGAQNDFVFAVIGEEMGLMGTLVVLILFGVLGYAGLRVAMRSETIFGRVVATGITCWTMFQALVNMGVAMKLLPVVGVPLPFISAGGSALFANVLAIGVLLACARNEPAAREARAVRRAGGEPRPKVTTVVDARR